MRNYRLISIYVNTVFSHLLVKFLHSVITFLDIKRSLCYNNDNYAAKKENSN